MSTNGGSVKAEEGVSPTNKEAMGQETPQPMASVDNSMKSLEMRADPDPDAQSTVTDFLDFTEYLPSDIIRSLTLIGKLDQSYYNASDTVHDLTSTWGQLPNLPADERPSPVRLRADISEALRRVVDSRTFSHAEAVRMSENVTRHYHRAKAILSKLETMLENYPTAEEQTSPVAVSKSPKVSKTPKVVTLGPDNKKVRRPMVPRITVPGEVLAPYDNFEPYSSDSEASSDYDEIESTRRPIPVAATPTPRIKVVRTQKTPKPPKTPKPTPSAPQLSQAPQTSQPSQPSQPFQASQPAATPIAVAASAVVAEGPTDQPPPPVKQAPPSNVVIGSAEAPWLQLTPFELARLRKRMKKNATWTPSDAMIARELNDLGRGVEAYREAKRKAEEEGRAIDPPPAAVVAESQPGSHKLPEGALSAAALSSEGVPSSNRGMKLNEAKRQKRESLAKQAAEEAEESARRFNETARKLMTPQQPTPSVPAKPNNAAQTKSTSSRNKRKRHSIAEGEDLKPDTTDTSAVRPPLKRTKTETPVPLPQLRGSVGSQPLTETPIPPPVLTPNGSTTTPQSSTPVPIPVPGQDALKRTMSPAASNTMTIAVPSKSPAETPVAPPSVSPRKSTTPILPPVREPSKRETRGDVAKKTQQQQQLKQQAEGRQSGAAVDAHAQAQQDQARSSTAPSGKHAASRSSTPSMLPGSDEVTTRTRPSSRGKAPSQEPQTSLAADRPRRSSTARNTPAPEAPAASSRRTRRPAPGVVSTTSSGGSSAVGRRKKAPSVKRRVRSQKKDNGQTVEEMEEVDDEGNSIDPNEPRYCVCNRVSFGTMISCDNASCPMEWFHLECVGLSGIPPRTTKWYCPDCRVALNIGERGEVNARGVKT